MGIEGAAWATNVDFAVAGFLNMYFVYRYVGFSIDVRATVKTIVAAAIMGGVVLITYDAVMLKTFHNTIATLLSISVGGIVYGITLLLLGGIKQREVEKVPKVGVQLANMLCKIGLLRK